MKSILQVFASRRMFVTLLLGFSAGIPLALTGSTLQAWLTESRVDIKTIGLFSLVGIPYTWKFIWSPLMDRYFPKFLGRRRGWMLISQTALMIFIAWMGLSDPVGDPQMLAILAVIVAFFSSSQDIVVDAYRTEMLPKEEYGAGSGVYIMGYRLAMLTSGALVLFLTDQVSNPNAISWKSAYFLMAGSMVIGILGTLFGPEPESEKAPKTLAEAVTVPFVDFFKRPGAIEVLIFIILYKLDGAVASALMTKFFMDLGFAKAEIAAVTKVFGLIATIVGTLIGGALMYKLGLRRALIYFGILQGATNLLFYMMSQLGQSHTGLMVTIAGENLTGGMGTAAYSAFIMTLCNKKFTATQYALLTSLMAMTRVLAGAPTGYLQASVGWGTYFIISTLLCIPALLMLTRYDRWQMGTDSDSTIKA
jgi:PAT family beta-lactamase induction signal transducer AmpG